MTEIRDICNNGIYLLYLGDKLQYIGKSKDVYKRFISHVGEFQFDNALIFPTPDFSETFENYNLLEIERKLIYLYCPPYNTQHSKGAYRDKSFKDKIEEIVEYFDDEPCLIHGKPYQRFVEREPSNSDDIKCVVDWLIRKECECHIEFLEYEAEQEHDAD